MLGCYGGCPPCRRSVFHPNGTFDASSKIRVDSVGTAVSTSWERRGFSVMGWQSSSDSMMMVILSLGGISGMINAVDS